MITGIHISPSDLIIRKEAAKNAVFSSLKANQKTDVIVLKVFSENKAQVLLAGKKVIIKSPFLLKEGEKLQLNLLKMGENQNSKILSPDINKFSEKFVSLIKLVSKSNPFASLSKTDSTEIIEMLKSISLKSEKADKNFLPSLLNKSGITFEQKISTIFKQENTLLLKHELLNILKGDIKGTVLSQLKSSDHQNIGNLKPLFEYLSSIENYQVLNTQSSDTGKYLIPFPVFSNETFNFGQLFIDLGNSEEKQKTKGKDRIINISFLLNMSNLGGLRADFSIYKKAISGVFNLSSVEVCDLFEKTIPKLKENLLKIEYQARNIECKVVAKKDVSPASFVESFIRGEDRLLNIII
ncbi:MAG: hypothetical protein GY707_03065 [Desulfobacteraceae bacterium]|nr:hypothetical protein [Desulfobacteraceae bacterium]